ncbi:host attachment family protein [Paracoccus sp. (in: a-proteobacteria)]|uniref:host attachment family protein n=1 Tax=Paracoccus sp. TaxID=267 RepID=UPI0026E03B07|nr:host attachment family protein [Paracoccus sp. (in: a-proteobacteria)]MDO5369811.1 host attachment family protein [Paracoccus sp. (in: a-proteobacteria)]
MLSRDALVVVADGKKAVLFRNTAKFRIELEEVERIGPANLQDESQGRQPEDTSPRDEDEATFAKQLTERLNLMVLQNKVQELAIIADPNTLGVMRKNYHKMLEQKLVKEVAKTLTAASADEIARALA